MISAGLSHFAEFELQIIALSWMAILYVLKIYQMARLPMPWEKGPAKGSSLSGVLHTYANIFLPWSMESSKRHPWRWLEFAVYHVGALIAILNTFTTPFAPQMMTPLVRVIFALVIAPAFLMGITKLTRRILRPEMRLISSPDDYFALISVEIFFFAAIMALITDTAVWRFVYFIITAGFLFYVPFSKISHYIYLLFSGVITGRRYGWRGVRPAARRLE